MFLKKALSTEYQSLLGEIKDRIRSAQYDALRAVNKELIALYWDIGRIHDIFYVRSREFQPSAGRGEGYCRHQYTCIECLWRVPGVCGLPGSQAGHRPQ